MLKREKRRALFEEEERGFCFPNPGLAAHTHTLACAHLFEPGSRQQHPTHPDLHLSLAFEREKKNYHSPKISKLSKEHVNGTGEINKRHNDYRM